MKFSASLNGKVKNKFSVEGETCTVMYAKGAQNIAWKIPFKVLHEIYIDLYVNFTQDF